MRKALIIFVGDPEPGSAETRLANNIGKENAMQVYSQQRRQVHDAACAMDCDRFVYYGQSNGNDQWDDRLFSKRQQEGANPGEKKSNAFFELFEEGFRKIVLVEGGFPGIDAQLLNDAFERLATNDIVIGPTEDGKYYLMGLTHPIPDLFKNKEWGSDTVLRDTILNTVQLRKQCVFLPELFSISSAEDLERFRQSGSA
jgi:rSAM/selenodomain-associated transferase 1